MSCNFKFFNFFLSFVILLSGVFTAELPECMQELMTERTKDYYQHFLPIKEDKWPADKN